MFGKIFHLGAGAYFTCWIGTQYTRTINAASCNAPLIAKARLDGQFGIKGEMKFEWIPDVKLVLVEVNLSGLQIAGFGEYSYHVHTHPVGADGNCTSTRDHLDPFNISSKRPCDFRHPHLCQTGDLSGKFGKLSNTQDTASFHYFDPFLKFSPQQETILGRSVVLHAPGSKRLACGNITSWLNDTADMSGEPTFKPSTFNTS